MILKLNLTIFLALLKLLKSSVKITSALLNKLVDFSFSLSKTITLFDPGRKF